MIMMLGGSVIQGRRRGGLVGLIQTVYSHASPYKHARITTTMSMSTAGRWVVPTSGRRMALYSLCLDPE